MKEAMKERGLRLLFAVLAVSAVGVCVAYMGILFDCPRVWRVGTYMAVPLIVVFLPACVFLVALFPVAAVAQVVGLIRGRASGSNVSIPEEAEENNAPAPDH